MKKFFILSFLLAHLSAYADVIGGIDIPNLSTPECIAIKYSPIDIYSKPNGQKIGTLTLDNPELAQTHQPDCSNRPVIQSQVKNKTSNIETIEISYEHSAPAVYELVKTNKIWVKLKDKNNYVWIIKNPKWKYVSYEQDLVQGIKVVNEFCTKNKCTKTSTKKEVIITNNELGSCYGNVYEVNGKITTLPNGRKIYPAKMLDELIPLYGKKLPINTYIPVYSKNGKWNGFYYSRGC